LFSPSTRRHPADLIALILGTVTAGVHMIGVTTPSAKAMRFTLAIGVLISSCVAADAAQKHRAKLPARNARTSAARVLDGA